MAGLHFDITGDNSNLMDKLRQTETGIRNTARTIEQNGVGMEKMFNNIAKAATGIGAAFSAQQFAGQVMKVRGEFQQLEVAFNTMLGSAEKANTLMTQLTRTAAITPFGLQDVAGGAKQLLAYGVASEQVNDTLIRLGDIAAGLSIPLNDLVYLYGTTMTQGRMFTQDLRQFQGRGIPLADELAKQFGVTKDKVGELVTAGKVGFEEMHKAIVSMTSDGGKFGGLMEAQSKTITGQISNIQDAIDGMFNQIGQSSEGMINTALGGVSALVENWEKVADAIGLAVASYGFYKAALMVTAAVDGIKTDIASTEEITGLKELLGLKEESKNKDLEAAVAKGTLTQAKAEQMAALRKEVQARLASLNLMKEEAIAEENAALDAFNLAKQEKDAADERLENMMNLMEAAEAKGDASYTAYAQEQLQTAAANANTAANRLNTAEKNLNAASSKTKAASTAADTFATNANTIANNANTRSLSFMKAAALQLQGILKSMYATLMANPLAIVVGAVGALIYGIYQYATRASAAEKATKLFNDALEEQAKNQEEHKRAIDELISILGDVEISEGKRIENFHKLKQEYPEILKNINTETEFLKEKHKILQLINQEQSKEQQKDAEYLLRVEEQKLKRWENHRKNYGDTSLVDVDGNGWASDNVVEAINAQRDIINQLKAKISQPIVESYLAGIKELKNENITSTIEDVTNILISLEGAGDNAIGILTSLGAEFSKGQLKTLKSALEAEQSARGGEKKSSSQWIAKYKKEYDAAEKAISDFQKNRNELSEVEFERQLKNLKDKRDAAKKKYEDAGDFTERDKRLKQKEEADRKKLKLSEELLSIRRKNQQDEIDLMKDGTEKKFAQINLDYQKEIDAINKQKAEWKKAQNGLLTEQQEAALKQRGLLAEKNRAKSIEDANKELLEKYQDYATQRVELEKKYNDDIHELQVARNKAEESGDKKTADKLTKSIAQAYSDKGKALLSFDFERFKESPEYVQAFEDLGNTSTETLQNLISELERYKNEAAKTFDAAGVREYTDAIQQIYDALLARNPYEGLVNAQKDLAESNDELRKYAEILEKVKKGQNVLKSSSFNDETKKTEKSYWNLTEATDAYIKAKDKHSKSESRFLKVLDTTKEEVDNLSNSIKGLGDSIGGSAGEIISLIGDVSLFVTSTIDGMAKVAATGANALSAVEKASVILGIISSAVQLLQKISNLLPDAHKQYQEYAAKVDEVNKLTDAVNSYKIAVLKAKQEEEGWFSENNLKNLKDYKERQEAVYQSYIDKMTEAQAVYQNKSGGGWLTDTFNGIMAFGSVLSPFEWWRDIWGYGGYDEGTTAAVDNLRIETRKASKGFLGSGIGGKSQKTEDLRTWAKKNLGEDLFDKDGWINVELANEILENYGDKLQGQTQETLEALIEMKEQYDEYIKQLRDYVSSLYEPLVDNFVDSLWDWFDEGKSALDSFKDYASETFRDIVSDMMKTIILEQVVGSFGDDIGDLYEEYSKGLVTEEQLMANVSERVDGLMSDYEDNIPMLQAMMSQLDSTLQEAGINLASSSAYSQEASSKGFEGMSQDTGDELNGRFAALQISGEEIKNQMIQAVSLISQIVIISSQGNVILSDILTQQALANDHLSDIAKYSKISSTFGDKLDSIIENTKNL